MKVLLAIPLILGISSLAIQDDPTECLQTIEEGWFCPRCDKILEPSETIDFDIGGDQGRLKACRSCAEKTPKDLRGLYKAAASRVDLCVRAYYECSACNKFRHSAEECCGNPMSRRIDRGRVLYRCEGCGRPSNVAGECPRRDDKSKYHCPKEGEPLTKRCSCAGTFPHGTQPPAPVIKPEYGEAYKHWGK